MYYLLLLFLLLKARVVWCQGFWVLFCDFLGTLQIRVLFVRFFFMVKAFGNAGLSFFSWIFSIFWAWINKKGPYCFLFLHYSASFTWFMVKSLRFFEFFLSFFGPKFPSLCVDLLLRMGYNEKAFFLVFFSFKDISLFVYVTCYL